MVDHGRRIPASARFDVTTVGGVDRPQAATYTCPTCGSTTTFDYAELSRRIKHEEDLEQRLTLTCSGCRMPIHVLVAPWEWRMTLWAYDLVAVLEL